MSGGGITVHGGADGIQAEIDDLLSTRALLERAAGEVADIAGTCRWLGITLRQLGDGADVWAELAAGDALDSAARSVDGLGHSIRSQALLLNLAVAKYRDADRSVLDSIGSSLTTSLRAAGKLPGAVVDGVGTWSTDGPAAAVQAFLGDDPELIDSARHWLAPLDAAVLRRLAYAYFDDGEPVVRPRRDVRLGASAPPRSVADLMAGLNTRNGGAAGEVDVRFLTGADGRRRVIVDIPGTKDWSPARESPNVVGWATNVRAIDGHGTSYERGVLEAMTRAGVRPDDDVLVVGHSLGGLVAVTLARDAVRSGRFHVTHVVTAGAPIGSFVGRVPAGIQVLALENEHDVVPHLDGAENPDLPNVTTAVFDVDRRSVGGNHGIDTAYGPGASLVDGSDDAAIRTYLEGAGGFFAATTVRTQTYVITRR